jgi:hypothetical protein
VFWADVWQFGAGLYSRKILWLGIFRGYPQLFQTGGLEIWLDHNSIPPSKASIAALLLLFGDIPRKQELKAFPYRYLKPAAVRAIQILTRRVVG